MAALKRGRLLLHAAKLLEDEAQVSRESCQGSFGLWSCGDCRQGAKKCRAELHHDDMLETAKRLRKQAA